MKLIEYDRIGSDEGCKSCIVEDEDDCRIDSYDYCGAYSDGKGHHLIPAPVAAATDAVIEAARAYTFVSCPGFNTDIELCRDCPTYPLCAALTALSQLDATGEGDGGGGKGDGGNTKQGD